jgi:hypothetical protein
MSGLCEAATKAYHAHAHTQNAPIFSTSFLDFKYATALSISSIFISGDSKYFISHSLSPNHLGSNAKVIYHFLAKSLA